MRDRPEIKDWQMVSLILLIIVCVPVIVAVVGIRFLVQWLRFRWVERCER